MMLHMCVTVELCCVGCVCRSEQQLAGARHGTCSGLALEAVDCSQLGSLTNSPGELP